MKRLIVPMLVIVVTAVAVSAVAGEASPKGVVNINTADGEQLQLLPRVGPALAERIINFREVHGPFKSVDELVAVQGIGERSLEHLKPYVTTTGQTTLEEKIRLPRQTGTEANS